MTGEQFAGFLASAGHRVVCSRSSYWFDASTGFFLSCPSHRTIDPAEDEVRDVLRHQPCVGIRFPAPANGSGKVSYQIVCTRRDYALSELSANTRSKVRRGLRRCEVTRLPFADLAVDGRLADAQTLARQGRRSRVRGSRWDRFWRAAAATPDMEAWGATADGKLIAFLVVVLFEDGAEFLMARSRSDCREYYANNALIYRVAEEMLAKRGVRQITFGLESLEPVQSLDDFKYSMGFERRPLRQRVEFHPWIHALVRSTRVRKLFYRQAARSGPSATFWRKTAGLMRFAEEGGL